MGTGKTRGEAFNEMQSLVETYLSAVLQASGPVRFYNPSDQADWEIKDKAEYHVVVVLSARPVSSAEAPRRPRLDELRPRRSQIQSIQLQPA